MTLAGPAVRRDEVAAPQVPAALAGTQAQQLALAYHLAPIVKGVPAPEPRTMLTRATLPHYM